MLLDRPDVVGIVQRSGRVVSQCVNEPEDLAFSREPPNPPILLPMPPPNPPRQPLLSPQQPVQQMPSWKSRKW